MRLAPQREARNWLCRLGMSIIMPLQLNVNRAVQSIDEEAAGIPNLASVMNGDPDPWLHVIPQHEFPGVRMQVHRQVYLLRHG